MPFVDVVDRLLEEAKVEILVASVLVSSYRQAWTIIGLISDSGENSIDNKFIGGFTY